MPIYGYRVARDGVLELRISPGVGPLDLSRCLFAASNAGEFRRSPFEVVALPPATLFAVRDR